MSKITLNPNSVFTNSQANFIINKDAVYAFNRSISAINNSVYGIQPTKAQYISGITLEDLEPLSSNHSLCAEVYFLNNNVDALKFFAQRPFVPCTSIENRDETAKNPLAIYLTPLPRYNPETGRSLSKRKLMNNLKNLGIWEDVKTFLESEGYQDDWDTSTTLDENAPMLQTAITALKATFGLSDSQVESLIANSVADDSPGISANDSYEWIYVLPESYTLSSGEVLSGWDFTKYVYESGELLTTFGGTWELIGSTSLTDEKISALFGDLNVKIEAVSAAHDFLSTTLSNAIDDLSTGLSTAINNLSSDLSGDIDDLSTALSNTVEYLSVGLSTTIDFLSTELSNAIDDLSEGTEGEIEDISAAIDQISATLSSLSNDLSTAINTLSSDLSGDIDKLSSDLSGEIDSLSTALSGEINNLSTALSGEIDKLSTALSGDIDDLSTGLSTAINTLSSDLSGDIDKLSAALSGEIDTLSTNLSTAINTLSSDLSGEIDKLSTALSGDIDDLSTQVSAYLSSLTLSVSDISTVVENILTNDIPTLSAELTNTISAVSNDLCVALENLSSEVSSELSALELSVSQISGTIDDLSTALSLEISSVNKNFTDFASCVIEELSTNINPKLSTIAECVSAEVKRVDEISAKIGNILSSSIPTLSNHLRREIKLISSDLSDAIEELDASLSDYALSTTVADAYKLSVGNAELCATESSADYDSFIYRFYQGQEEVGHIDVPRDQFISAAEFEGTILVLELQGGHKISTDLKDVVDILTGDAGEVTNVSVYVNPETNIISAALLEEYATVSQLSDALSDYIKKSDLCAAILPNLEEYNHYLSGDIPRSISAIYDWNCAIHTALLSCCGVLANYNQ